MNLHWLVTNLIAALILPPMGLILLACVGWLISHRWLYAGRTVIVMSALLLIALSTEAGAGWLARPLEQQAQQSHSGEPHGQPHGQPQAIVILGGGRMRSAGTDADPVDQVSPGTLMRLRAGAALHRQTRLPILVTGGAPDRPGDSEGSLMATSLKQDFGVPVRWVEDQAANTAENALLSARLLRPQSIRRVWLVTDAIHMPRARMAFERAGIDTVPAPSAFIANASLTAASFIPSAQALRHSHFALHEWLGLLWYRISLGAAI